MADRVLITTDDLEHAVRINAQLETAGFHTALVSSFDDVRRAVGTGDASPDCIVLTGGLHESSAAQLLRIAHDRSISTLGLVEPTEPDPKTLAREIGLTAFLAKPADPTEVTATVRRLIERRRLQQRTGIIGESPAVQEVLVKLEQMAPANATVLIEVESGTGKELVARAIHDLSPRRGKPFVPVNCAALPETLLESELFGHEKGSFTGAAERRLGRFELANTGTLFLDEIGEAPKTTQVKLVRVVAATNRPLREEVEEGSFRADLYYRLNVLSIYLPPLRERRADIPLLVRSFIKEFSSQHDRPFQGISAEAMQILMTYPWPGNVRELRNLIESMVVLAPGREIGPEDIPRAIREGGSARFLPVHVGPVVRGVVGAEGRELEFLVRSMLELRLQVEELRRRLDAERDHQEVWVANPREVQPSPLAPGRGTAIAIEAPNQPAPPTTLTLAPGMTMAQIERAAIEAALKETRGNRRKAAEILDIGERTLYRKLRDYGIAPEALAGA